MSDLPPIIRTVAQLRRCVAQWRAAGEVIGLVPTMGALHAGHISLAKRARHENTKVIATIFVNPAQFNNAEDLERYPRDERADAALLAQVPVDVIFAPPPEEVYPQGYGTKVEVAGVSAPLEGEMRPGHFDGVATVVAKLFGMSGADHAYFGEKDWQQLQVIRALVRDLNIPIKVVGTPTLRESDGLAMSSRNRRLSAQARAIAPALYAALQRAAAQIKAECASGKTADISFENMSQNAMRIARQNILDAGFSACDYITLRDAHTLLPPQGKDDAGLDGQGGPIRIFAAAWLDGVRLIDNIAL